MKSSHKYFLLIIFFCVTLLSSCATLHTSSQPATHYMSWKQRQQQLQRIDRWSLQSALGINYHQQNSIAHADWQQFPDRYQLLISSALHLASIKISGNQHMVTLWKVDGKKVSAKTPEQLMEHELGWALPLTNLQYWIRGLPAPKIKYQAKFDHYNHVKTLHQQGWTINYSGFRSFNNVDLPTTIQLINQDVRIKLVINQWQFK